jgi:hypothetical protein
LLNGLSSSELAQDVLNSAGLYYGELFTEQAAAKLDRALEQAEPEEKLNILLASRVLYALLQPNKCEASLSKSVLVDVLLLSLLVQCELILYHLVLF